jgi:hypothetical protein
MARLVRGSVRSPLGPTSVWPRRVAPVPGSPDGSEAPPKHVDRRLRPAPGAPRMPPMSRNWSSGPPGCPQPTFGSVVATGSGPLGRLTVRRRTHRS